MSKNSAFARVIGLTKSFSPLGFDRSRVAPDAGETDEIVAAAVADSAAQTSNAIAAEPAPAIAAEPMTMPEAAPPQGAADAANGAQMVKLAEVDEVAIRDAVAADAIQTIEDDIARLLASLEAVNQVAAEDDEAEPDDAEGEPTLALLSELNRLWMTDHGGAGLAAQ
jgi:hypothetical protein